MSTNISEVRRENIRGLIAQRGGLTKLSKKLGYKNPSFLSQMTGPDPSREVSEKTARKIEQILALESGYLDREAHSAPNPSQGAGREINGDVPELAAAVVKLVGRACADEDLDLGPNKFADVVALVLADTFERGAPQEERIRQMLRLLK